MDVGVALPQMATGLDRARIRAWCEAIDAGPFSSVSAGERITYHNLDGFTLCSAAAALTERVRVFFNLAVLPWHPPAMAAKELASLDVLSGGRLEVAVGVGGRQQDYEALGASFAARFRRLDEGVAELRRLWAGGLAADGSAVGPEPVQRGGPPVFASPMGPKSMARAAQWADGVSGFNLLADPAAWGTANDAITAAWAAAGRTRRPRLISGAFVCLGPDSHERLKEFASSYLRVLAGPAADQLAELMPLHTPEAVRAALDAARQAGVDEFIVVPATSDPAMIHELTAVVNG